jgi:hypothetical protein
MPEETQISDLAGISVFWGDDPAGAGSNPVNRFTFAIFRSRMLETFK